MKKENCAECADRHQHSSEQFGPSLPTFEAMNHETGETILRQPERADVVVTLGKGLTKKGSKVTPREEIDKSHLLGDQGSSSDPKILKSFTVEPETLGAEHSIPKDLISSDLKNLKHLVDGCHSNIFKGEYTAGRFGVIVKTIRARSMSNKIALQEYHMELAILARLQHPNIVKLLGIGKFVARNGRERPFLMLEKLIGGTLQDMLSRRSLRTMLGISPLSYRRAIEVTIGVARALQYLHEDFHPDAVLVHRDLKPDNLAFDGKGMIKLIDFGLCTANQRKRGHDSSTYNMTGNTGSVRYMAPEVAKNEPYSEKVDIYSLSIITWQMITGTMPFRLMNREQHYQRVCLADERPEITPRFDPELRQILKNGWSASESKRPKASEIVEQLTAYLNRAPASWGNSSRCCTGFCRRYDPLQETTSLMSTLEQSSSAVTRS